MSLAVNLTMRLARQVTAALKDIPGGIDIEIIERHHRFKEDAPSGTALRFGEIIADIMGQSLQAHGRSGRPGKRPRHEIGYHALRTGDNPGEWFGMADAASAGIGRSLMASNFAIKLFRRSRLSLMHRTLPFLPMSCLRYRIGISRSRGECARRTFSRGSVRFEANPRMAHEFRLWPAL